MHSCKLGTWLTYSQGKRGLKNEAAQLGIVVHNILEEYGKYCLKNEISTDYDKFDKIAYRAVTDLPEHLISDAKIIIENVKNNTNWETIIKYPIVEIERRFKLDENFNPTEDDEPYFSGGLDLLCIEDDVAYAEDYKTVRAIYTNKAMEESLQRKFYSWLVLKYYPQVNVVKFKFNFSRYGYISEPYEIYRDDLENLEKELKEEIEAYYYLVALENPPEANPGSICILCENKGNCEAYKNAFSIDERMENSEDASDLLGSYKIAKLKLAGVEKMLRAWVEANGPIINNKDVYGPNEENKTEYNDIQKLIELLRKNEIPVGAIYDAVKLSNTEVKKLIKKFKLSKDAQADILKLAILSKKTKWKITKLEEEDQEENESFEDPYL